MKGCKGKKSSFKQLNTFYSMFNVNHVMACDGVKIILLPESLAEQPFFFQNNFLPT
jgi:hypothetical protein